MNTNEFLGFMSGLIISLVIVMLYKKRKGKMQYDERQNIIIGKAYSMSFTIFAIYAISAGVLCRFTGQKLFGDFVFLFLGFCIALTYNVIYRIKNDAYVGVNEYNNCKLDKRIRIIFVIGILSIVPFVLDSIFDKSPIIEDGLLNISLVNLMAGIMIITISIVFKLHNNKDADLKDY